MLTYGGAVARMGGCKSSPPCARNPTAETQAKFKSAYLRLCLPIPEPNTRGMLHARSMLPRDASRAMLIGRACRTSCAAFERATSREPKGIRHQYVLLRRTAHASLLGLLRRQARRECSKERARIPRRVDGRCAIT